jgi:hypothetical protein
VSAAVLALLLVPALAFAAEDAAPPPGAPAPQAAGTWTREGRSLLLRDARGEPSVELPLRAGSEDGVVERETLGGASPEGRLAWTLDRTLTWTPGRTRLLGSKRLFRLYGDSGRPLWSDDEVDLPERGPAVLFSADGRTLLLARRGTEGWTVQARTWMGKVVATLGPFSRLEEIELTPNGRFALARWSVPDKSDTHTFADLKTGARRDVASSDLLLGRAEIGDDGVVRSGSRVAFSLASSTAAAAAVPTAPAAGAGTP